MKRVVSTPFFSPDGGSRGSTFFVSAVSTCALTGLLFQTGCSGEPSDESPSPEVSPTPRVTPTPSLPPELATPTVLPDTPTPTPVPTPTPTPEPTPTPTATPEPGEYTATIRRDSFGIPHILADDLGSLGFGQGYSFAEAHACTLADQIVKVRSERSLYFGAGTNNANLVSDFGILGLRVYAYAREAVSALPPELEDMLRGYAAGYNHYLQTVGAEGLPSECAGQPWVKPISPVDLLAYYLMLPLMASGGSLLPNIVDAQPPGGASLLPEAPPLPNLRELEHGSNGWALGRDKTEAGGGMLLGNPHFPWEGENRFMEVHLTVPGQLDAYGVSLMGVMGLNIGFNASLGWTHTVTSAAHLTGYRLSLVPGNPTRYKYDGSTRDMTSELYTLQVKQTDGSLLPTSLRLYRSHYGPMITFDGVGWTPGVALTFRDANENNFRSMVQFFRMASAQSLEEFERAHEEIHGIPWAYTVATTSEGDALFLDGSSVPALSDATVTAWQAALEDDVLTQQAYALGIPLLDGSTSRDEWVNSPDTYPGLEPYERIPRLLRSDFVLNANDSPWLTHPAEPLEEYPVVYGSVRTPRSPRTRMNLVAALEQSEEGSSGADGRFNLEELTQTAFSNRGILAELLLPAVLVRCTGVTDVSNGTTTVNITPLCDALGQWDGREDLESVGAVAWREFIGSLAFSQLVNAGTLFAVPFDPNDPVNTPNGLAPAPSSGDDPLLVAMANAVLRLQQANLTPAATLGETQFTLKKSGPSARGTQAEDYVRYPIQGGLSRDGVMNVISHSNSLNSTVLPRMPRATELNALTDLTTEGYLINYGSSFVFALAYDSEGLSARAVLSYGQSDDPSSPHYTDQTVRFGEKDWRTILFDEQDLLQDPNLTIYDVRNF